MAKEKKKTKKKAPAKKGDIKRMKGSVVPVAFEDFVTRMEKKSEATHRKTVTIFSDENGMFMSVPRQGSNEGKISLFLNKSRGWEPDEDYSELTIDNWHTGDVRAAVVATPKAIKQAVKLCNEWRQAKEDHSPEPMKGKSEDKPKKKKKKDKKGKKAKDANGEDKPKKKRKKKKGKKSKKSEARAEA